MRVATVDGLVTLFYDGSEPLYNANLNMEWSWGEYDNDEKKIEEWESWDLSDECKQYFRERLSWQQVIVMEDVTVIPEKTFRNCKSIQRVIFANTVVRIGSFAFAQCTGLVFVKWSINLEYIGEFAFCYCNLSSVFIPPRCREIRFRAFSLNSNLTIFHIPQDVELGSAVFSKTKLIADSPFGNENGYYNSADGEVVNNWMKNINNDAKYALHRACCSFQPLKEVIFTILKEKGIGVFKVKNEAGITPSQYLKENPYADIDEMDIIRDFALKMMGEI